jgi:hypothetical protein
MTRVTRKNRGEMANALYDPGREGFLDGSIDWDTDDIRVMLASRPTPSARRTSSSPTSARSTTAAARRSAARPSRAASPMPPIPVAHADRRRGERADRLQAHRQRRHRARHRLHRHSYERPALHAGGQQTVNITWDNGANKIFKL